MSSPKPVLARGAVAGDCAMSRPCAAQPPVATGSMFWFSRNTFVGS